MEDFWARISPSAIPLQINQDVPTEEQFRLFIGDLTEKQAAAIPVFVYTTFGKVLLQNLSIDAFCAVPTAETWVKHITPVQVSHLRQKNVLSLGARAFSKVKDDLIQYLDATILNQLPELYITELAKNRKFINALYARQITRLLPNVFAWLVANVSGEVLRKHLIPSISADQFNAWADLLSDRIIKMRSIHR